MGFLDSYKSLEKLCSEIYRNNHGISSYIDEMINTPVGINYVKGWNDDLRLLKHYRWVRNKIVHEPDCNEENMCESDDAIWLDNFYSRIISTDDPLALYRKIKNQSKPPKSQQVLTSEAKYNAYSYKNNTPHNPKWCAWDVLIILLVLIVLIAIAVSILKFTFYKL